MPCKICGTKRGVNEFAIMLENIDDGELIGAVNVTLCRQCADNVADKLLDFLAEVTAGKEVSHGRS